MVPIVSKKYQFILGVDTHAKQHVLTLINQLGVVVATRTVKVTVAQMTKAIDWLQGYTNGQVLCAIEGTSSYGETFTNLLLAAGLDVCEVHPPKTKSRGGQGKTDSIDAERAARNVLYLPADKLLLPRRGSKRKALRILLGSRRLLTIQQTMDKNALTALLRTIELGLDARRSLCTTQYQTISHWKTVKSDSFTQATARLEAKRLATAVVATGLTLEANLTQLTNIIMAIAPDLLDEVGFGPVTVAQILCAYAYTGRIRSAAAFAALAGASPVPASSGNTVRYRLNRYGDRTLNHALTTVAMARLRVDESTKQYAQKKTAEGHSAREIRRILKRYIARRVFKQLEVLKIGVDW